MKELLDKLTDMIIEQVNGDENAPLELKACASLTQVHKKSQELINKLAKNKDFELDKVYEQQFNAIIHYSKVLISEMNEIIGEENE